MPVGQIYFALVNSGEVFDDQIHIREDEDVFNLTISQSEGSFARATVEIKNPSQGLLSPTRKERVFISYQDGANVVLLFAGRVTGFPNNIVGETISLEYIAQPEDWEVQQDAFIQTLKTSPEYNPLFVASDRRNEASEILAGRSELIHWSRDSLQISTSDILEGSQLLDLGEEFFFDTINCDLGDPPLSKINLTIEAQWEQIGVGTVDAAKAIQAEFNNDVFDDPYINTLTPLAFEDGWRGVRIPSGYRVQESKLSPEADGFNQDDQLTDQNLRSPTATVQAADFPTRTGDTVGSRTVTVPRVWYKAALVLQAAYQQKRREIASATIITDNQNFSLKGNREENLTVRIQNPTEVEQGQVLDPRMPSFFYDNSSGELTTYGREVIEHGIKRAMARLKKASRMVETTFEADLDQVVGITTDHSVRIEDRRIPGGSLRGKVISYTFVVDGDSGQQIAKIKIGSSIGKGDNSVGSGAPSEVEIGSVQYENEFGGATVNSSVFYDLTLVPSIPIPIDVQQMESDDQYLMTNVTVTNDGQTQCNNFNNDPPQSRPDLALETGTGVEIDLRSLNPEPELFAEVPLTTFKFALPKHADLEAE